MGAANAVSIEDLFACADLVPCGPFDWNIPIPERKSGVYAISVGGISIDPEHIAEPARHRWIVGQHIVYIGRAKNLRKRLQQFYRHKYGAHSPHRGGQSILLLGVPLHVSWSAVDDYAGAEDRMIEQFRAVCGRVPFGNRVKSARMRPSPLEAFSPPASGRRR
jgi:hypothetical protein